MKVVINACFGGFGLSLEAARWMAERGSVTAKEQVEEFDKEAAWIRSYLATGTWPKDCPKEQITVLDIDARCFQAKKWYSGRDYERHDPLLVTCVKALGEKVNGEFAELRVIDIPDGTDYSIEEYDGSEHIAEVHKTWR